MTAMIVTYLLFSIRHAIGLENLTARLRRTTEELRQEGEKVNHLAYHDVLTGLPNRLSFRNEVERALRRTRRGESFALLYLDLDRFKDVNDTLGHPIGDALLRDVAARLQAEVREVDTVARLGGDEFAMVQTDVRQPNAAQALATRCIEALSEPYIIDEHRIVVGVSIGVALAGADSNASRPPVTI
jgi:diguanylate cyclase (GGDEF)-like protein